MGSGFNSFNRSYISRLSIFFLLLFTFSVNDVKCQQTDGVVATWQRLKLHHDFGKNWNAGVLTNFRVSCNYGFYDWFIQGYVGYNILSWFEAQVLYRQEYLKIDNDVAKWTYERRPIFRISSKFAYGNLKLRQRNSIEFRTFELLDPTWRFRSDIRVKYSTGLTSFNISPYVTEEVFVTERGLSRNRLYIGISGTKGRFAPAMYMLMQSDEGKEQWFSRWILGALLAIRL